MYIIIAFKRNLEGVLLACIKFKISLDSPLIYADTLEELEKKIEFIGIKEPIEKVGFTSNKDIKKIVTFLFGNEAKNRFKNPMKNEPDLINFIDLVLKHVDNDPVEFVKTLASCKSIDALFTGKQFLHKKYYKQMREVLLSYHRLCMFVRPDVFKGILIAEINTRHRIQAMFCRWLANKNSDLPVAIVQGSKAWIGNGQYLGLDKFTVVTSSFLNEFKADKVSNDIHELWDIYYDSQMIDNRRNKRQAKQFQPKSSSLLSNMSKKDRYKIERGISTCKLEDFL